jgi:Flp pilus assembly protein TadG
MTTNAYPHSKKNSSRRAQAIVEFAIVLPVLLMMLVGILEVGRLIFIYAAVNNASREAARYASAVGLNDAQTAEKYRDCAGIKAMAKRSAFFVVSPTTTIDYDHGSTGSTFDQCDGSIDTGVTINSGTNVDRVTVTVTIFYKPMVNLIPLRPRNITAVSSRTILGILKLAGSGSSGGLGGGSSTSTPTATTVFLPTDTPIGTSTFTETPNPVNTLTPQPSPTITLLPSSTPTFTPTDTPTETATSTPTMTPTSTSTPVSTCAITAGQLDLSTGSSFINVALTNPYVDVTISSVRLQWNASTGGTGGTELTWSVGILSGNNWDVGDKSGDYTSPTNVILPGYNATSMLTIAFDKYYENPVPKGTIITVNFAAPECNSVTVVQ